MYITERLTHTHVEVEIIEVEKDDLPLKKNGWKFNWETEFKDSDSTIYSVRQLNNKGDHIEAIMSVKFIGIGDERFHHFVMNLLEVAPHNAGTNGQFSRSVGILIGHVCEMSYTIEGNYMGMVLFSVKEGNTKLINHYKNEYGAIMVRSPIMAFEPPNSEILMDEYLN